MRSADSDGEGIDPRAGGEFLHFVGRSEQRVVRLYLDVVLDARQFSKFRFHHDAVIVRVFDDFLRNRDVFFPGLRGSVDHDGSEAAVDGRLADLEIRAVVEVHDEGNIRRFHRGLNEMSEIYGVGVFSGACGNLQDNGRLAFVRRFDDGLDHFHVVDVESADGITAGIRLFEHFGTGN